MPLWVGLYLLVLIVISVVGTWHNVRQRRPLWYLLLNAGNECLVTIVGAAYWLEPLGLIIAPAAFVLFIMGLAWLPIEIKTELASDTLKNPELSATGNMVAAACAILFGLFLFAPLYYWGFQFAILGHTAYSN